MNWTLEEMKAECRGVMRDARRAASQGVVLAPIAFVFGNVHETTGAECHEVVVVPCNGGRETFLVNVRRAIEMTKADGVVVASEAYVVHLQGGSPADAADLLKRARAHKLSEDELREEGISVVLDTAETTCCWQASIKGEEGKAREVSRFVEGPSELAGGMVEFFPREGRTTMADLEKRLLDELHSKGCNVPSPDACERIGGHSCEGCEHWSGEPVV